MHYFDMVQYDFEKFAGKYSIWKLLRHLKLSKLSFNALTIIVFLTFKFFHAIFKRLFPVKEDGDDFDWERLNKRNSDFGSKENTIRPFKISVRDRVLTNLNLRLEGTRYEESLQNSGFKDRFNSIGLQKVTEYWRTQYDWRKREKELNKYPQFQTRIDGLDVHFFHVKPNLTENRKLRVRPLLLIHGWPGSCANFNKLIPLLTDTHRGQDFVFEVVCPSIPGFGFSESPNQKELNGKDVARMFLVLMDRLGYSQFYVQGCDWGAVVASLIARFCPTRVQGIHVNMCFSIPKYLDSFLKITLLSIFPFMMNPVERQTIFPLKEKLKTLWNETGYSQKSDILGCAMTDSPAGMAAYFTEKVLTVDPEISSQNGELLEKSKLDEILTMVTVCWVNNNFTSGARFYKNIIKDLIYSVHERLPLTVPVGIAVFPHLFMLPKTIMQQEVVDLISYTIMPKGRHLVAMEEPHLLAKDVFQFVQLVENR